MFRSPGSRLHMKVTIVGHHKSITPVEIELPSFVVLTGLNGSGKTQFLESLASEANQITRDDGLKRTSRRFISSNQLVPNEVGPGMVWNLPGHIEALWDSYQYAKGIMKRGRDPRPHVKDFFERTTKRHLRKFNFIATHAGKDLMNLGREDFEKHYPLDDTNTDGDLFGHQVQALFQQYFEKQLENRHDRFRHEGLGEKEVTFLAEEEFFSKYGNPRLEINAMMESAGLGYEFNEPQDTKKNAVYVLKLIDKARGNDIDLRDLSSGEKVIISLVFAMYNAKLELDLPEVLLLDEPDASLHPSMTKQLLDVLESVFVREKEMFVVMTTHSPSTVALAPEESLFVVNKSDPRIEKTTKDRALGLLTEGVRSLSISYENRRQVFVESNNDVMFYEGFYEKLRNNLVPEISLNFIASGESKTDKVGQKVSNCEQVINITTILREKGNKTVFGIVDWDKKNVGNECVKVLGEEKRYSVDNYLLDPLLVGFYLLREKFVSENDVGLDENTSYLDIKTLGEDQFQAIIDFVILKVKARINPTSDETTSVKYVSGLELTIPVWYLYTQGHALEEHLKIVFPQLNRYRDEAAVEKEILNKVVSDFPEMIPLDLLDLFRSLQDGY